ncbi:MAG: hypothetical protein ABI885_14965, partial [Gammaproteobacteria bacterium]
LDPFLFEHEVSTKAGSSPDSIPRINRMRCDLTDVGQLIKRMGWPFPLLAFLDSEIKTGGLHLQGRGHAERAKKSGETVGPAASALRRVADCVVVVVP